MGRTLKLDFEIFKEEVIGPVRLVLLKSKTMWLIDVCDADEDAETIIYNSTEIAKYLKCNDADALWEFSRIREVIRRKLPTVDNRCDYPDELKKIMDDWDNRVRESEVIFPFIRGASLEFIYKNMRYVIYPNASKGIASHNIYFDHIREQLENIGVTHIMFNGGVID